MKERKDNSDKSIESRQIIDDLQGKVSELEMTIVALGEGEVDAVLLPDQEQKVVVTQPGVEYAYRAMIESMHEGAAIVIDEIIVYCNGYLAKILEMPLEKVIGQSFNDFVPDAQKPYLLKIFETSLAEPGRFDVILSDSRGTELSLQMSINTMTLADQLAYCVVVTDLSERIVKELQLAAAVFQSSSEAMMVCDEHRDIITVNPAFTTVTGFEPEEVIGRKTPLFNGDDNAVASNMWHAAKTLESWHGEIDCHKKDGLVFVADLAVNKIRDKELIPRYIVLFSDVTERKNLEDRLRKLSQAVEQSASSVLITDLDGNILYANTTFTNVTGYSVQEVMGKNPRFLQSGKTPSFSHVEMWKKLLQGESWRGEFYNRRKDGSEYIDSALISPVRDENGVIRNYLSIQDDITEKKQAEERIDYLAHFDSLTNLPNRVLLKDRFQTTLNFAKRNKRSFSVCFLDIDHFKTLNDTLGHDLGDEILVEMAKRFQSVLRSEDTISRLGGDEFVFILPDSDVLAATHIAQKLLAIVSQPIEIQTHHITTTASIGISMYPNDGNDMDSLFKCADDAMYQVKHSSRNDFRFYTEEMQLNSQHNTEISNQLYNALENNEFEIYYQPQICLADHSVIGAEALLRWNSPVLGPVSPGEFIRVAEDNGQIIAISEWIIWHVSQQMREWIDRGLPMSQVSINLSAIQFRQPMFLEKISALVSNAGLDPKHLDLELTESIAMGRAQETIKIIRSLNDMGFNISIDDFGTGYSSLSYLKRFAIYKLKIDQSFVRDLHVDKDDQAIVRAIISLANELGLKSIAEGVENAEQLAFLKEQGCDEVQGYYFSKPISLPEFEAFVHDTKN